MPKRCITGWHSVSGADGNAFMVKNVPDINAGESIHDEREHAGFFPRRADDADSGIFANSWVAYARTYASCCSMFFQAQSIHVFNGGAQTDRVRMFGVPASNL